MSGSKIIKIRLLDYASQEGCDGEPYDTMVAAARYIGELESCLNLLGNSLSFCGPEWIGDTIQIALDGATGREEA